MKEICLLCKLNDYNEIVMKMIKCTQYVKIMKEENMEVATNRIYEMKNMKMSKLYNEWRTN